MFFRKKKDKTFMEREIYAQPKILNDILECYVKDDEIKFDIPEGIEKVILVASGSSYNCARFSADLFDKIANIEASTVHVLAQICLIKSQILKLRRFIQANSS